MVSIQYSKGEHLPPRQQAIIQALDDVGFSYTGIDDQLEGMEDGPCLGGFGISEEFDHGYWIAVQHLETLDTWGFPLDEETHDLMNIQKVVELIGDAIKAYDTKDQLPLPLPEPEPTPETVSVDYVPPIPSDAFIVMGAKGKFAIKQIDGGALIGRWVTQKAGPKFTRHFIPTDGNCDCKASQMGKNCCHSKALDHHQYQQKEEARREQEREQERLRMLEKYRYELVVTDIDGNEKTRNFEKDIYSAQFHWDLSQKNPSTISTVINDRLLNKTIAKWRRPMIATA